MNATDIKKCQADGFDVKDLSKAGSIKDNEGSTMLYVILQQMKSEDKEFKSFKYNFSECYTSVKSNVEFYQSEIEDKVGRINERKSAYQKISDQDNSIADSKFG